MLTPLNLWLRLIRRTARPLLGAARKHTAPARHVASGAASHGRVGYGNVVTRNTLKSGPVTGARGARQPTGVGGVIPAIGKLIVPAPNVPLTNGAPNRSCTLRTSYRRPTLRTLDRSTDTGGLTIQL